MKAIVISALLLHALGASVIWFKANSKDVFNFNMPAWAWWLLIGWAIEYCCLHAWWQMCNTLGPYVASIYLSAIGTIVTMTLMSFFYGFNARYLLSATLVLLASFTMRG